MTEQILTAEEALTLITKIAPKLGIGDYTQYPEFPKKRKDVCALKHTASNGSSYGFDTIYLIWKEKNGEINHRKLADTQFTKDYLHIFSVSAEGNQINVDYGSGGSYSGSPWKDSKQTSI
jgi:hypothetical protein